VWGLGMAISYRIEEELEEMIDRLFIYSLQVRKHALIAAPTLL